MSDARGCSQPTLEILRSLAGDVQRVVGGRVKEPECRAPQGCDMPGLCRHYEECGWVPPCSAKSEVDESRQNDPPPPSGPPDGPSIEKVTEEMRTLAGKAGR